MTPPPSGALAGHTPSPFDYLSLMLLRWRLIAGTAVAAGVVALVTTFAMSSEWTAKTSFLPVSSSAGAMSSALGSLAGDLGIALPGGATTDGPEFYLALLKSRPILDAVLDTRYPVDGDSAPLLDILDAGGSTDAQRRERARDDLLDRLGASSDRTTRIVSLAIRAPDPQLAAAVANRFVELANRYNQENRAFQARETRRFVQSRLEQSAQDLRGAEEEQRVFRTRNRRFETPELQLEDQRLGRQVEIQRQLYMSLRTQYENSRIQEVNDTPVLSVIEEAVPPVQRSSPRRGRTTVLALVLGGVLGAGLALTQGAIQQLRTSGDPGYARLEAAWRRGQSGPGA
ncbi:MAG: hypothetical protein IPL76_00280 [Gemmatimonadetes bacterium]|nr:hypothetical protein [Gemmatimonadota bacterium]